MKRILTIVAMLVMVLSGLSLAQGVNAQGGKESAAKSPTCTTDCKACADVCEKTIAYCTKQGGKHAEASHINAIKDCASACRLSQQVMEHGSGLMSKACGLCREACLKCAESCDAFKDDKTMKACADECRKCAKSCEKMAS